MNIFMDEWLIVVAAVFKMRYFFRTIILVIIRFIRILGLAPHRNPICWWSLQRLKAVFVGNSSSGGWRGLPELQHPCQGLLVPDDFEPAQEYHNPHHYGDMRPDCQSNGIRWLEFISESDPRFRDNFVKKHIVQQWEYLDCTNFACNEEDTFSGDHALKVGKPQLPAKWS